jgi:hypothetical protein
LKTSNGEGIIFHPLLPDCGRGIDFWKIPMFRQSVLIRMTCRLMRVWSIAEMAFIGESLDTWRKTFLSAIFPTTNLTRTYPLSNPCLLGKRLATNNSRPFNHPSVRTQDTGIHFALTHVFTSRAAVGRHNKRVDHNRR